MNEEAGTEFRSNRDNLFFSDERGAVSEQSITYPVPEGGGHGG